MNQVKITARRTTDDDRLRRPVCRYCDAYTDIPRGAEGTVPPAGMSPQDWHDHARCVEGQGGDW